MKKVIFINTIITFALCFLTHFLYDWFPNPIFSIFFPVNESIWEHMKMIYTTILLYGFIEHFILKKFNINYNNYFLNIFLKSVLAIPIYLILYLPLYHFIGENFILNITILFISILIVNLIGIKILNLKQIHLQKEISVFLIIMCYIIMGILTYFPIKTELFYDMKEEKYGINHYIKK